MQFKKIVFTRVLVILSIIFLASCSSNLNTEEKEEDEEGSSEFVSLTIPPIMELTNALS